MKAVNAKTICQMIAMCGEYMHRHPVASEITALMNRHGVAPRKHDVVAQHITWARGEYRVANDEDAVRVYIQKPGSITDGRCVISVPKNV